MRHKSWTWRTLWIYFNLGMFAAYALFGIYSLFWPTMLEKFWLYLLHFAGLLLNFLILYCLIKRKFLTAYLVPAYSFAMILHLMVFIFVPISMALAYIGPSRSFYTLLILLITSPGTEEQAMTTITIFNVFMILVHIFNIWFFVSKTTVKMFRPPGSETS